VAERNRKPRVYELVEVLKNNTYAILPLPEGVESTNPQTILNGIKKAASKGDQRYDGKIIRVISYTDTKTIQAVAARKVTLV